MRKVALVAGGLTVVLGLALILTVGRDLRPRTQATVSARRPPMDLPHANGVIAFVHIDDRSYGVTGDLYTVEPDGTGLHRLTHSGDVTVNVAFSPDGAHIVFANSRSEDEWTIAVMNADGSGRRPITVESVSNPRPAIDEFPSWVPNGTQVRFYRNDRGGPAQGLWVANADGSHVSLVIPRWVPWEARWSPDGTRIAWEGDRGTGMGGADLFVSNPTGTDRHRLTSDPGAADLPAWSPDGHRIAFQNDGTIQVIGGDGSGRTTLFRCASGCASAGWPTWSPDGRQIAFVVTLADRTTQIEVMNADGTGVHPLLQAPFSGFGLTWQPLAR